MYGNERKPILDVFENPNSKKNLKKLRISNDHLKRYEFAITKYEKLNPYPKPVTSNVKLEQQYHSFEDHSSSDECLIKNKSKSTSSIDTQSINNILDEFEDLDRKSSDLSDIDVGSVEIANFEEIMGLQQHQTPEKKDSRIFKVQNLIRSRDYSYLISPSKVNRQTQVQQRSRDRQRVNEKRFLSLLDNNFQFERRTSIISNHKQEFRSNIRSGKVPPEILLRKGEVQKRVDEWLSQTRSHDCAGFIKDSKGLTRSNSSTEQKSHRRLKQRELRFCTSQLNGSSSYNDLTHEGLKTERNRDLNNVKISVGVNTSRGSYKQYLALKSKLKIQKQQNESANSDKTKTSIIIRSTESSPTASKIHCYTNGDTTNLNSNSSILKNQEFNEKVQQMQNHQQYQRNDDPLINVRGKNARPRHQMENRISSLVKAKNEISTTPEITNNITVINRQTSFKREIVRNSSRPEVTSISPNKSLKDSKITAVSRINEDKEIGRLISTKCEECDITSKVLESNLPIESNLHLSQEIYGSVSERVRAFQGRNDHRLSKLRSLEGSNILIKINESPMSLTINDGFHPKDNGRNKSTFRPNIVPHNQLNKQNFIKKEREIDLATKYVEKIYETALQPEVIHVDNLESVFSSDPTTFFYEENTLTDIPTKIEIVKKDNNVKQEIQTSHNNDSELKPLESKLNHCLKLLQKSPSFRLKRLNPVQKEKESYIMSNNNEQKINNEESNAINNFGSLKLSPHSIRMSQMIATEKLKETKGKQLVSLDKYDKNIYESRNTVKLSNQDVKHITEEDKRKKDGSVKLSIPNIYNGIINASEHLKSKSSGNNVSILEQTQNVIKENTEDDSVINEVLVKKQFKEELPSSTSLAPPPLAYLEHTIRQESTLIMECEPSWNQPLNYNSVLNNTSTNRYACTNHQEEPRSNKMYRTKAELERKKLMDLLKKQQFDLVKLELERSYTLCTPRPGSPICYPPCSPPPAPAIYVSNVKASCRHTSGPKLGAGVADVSQERDPFGKLVRYLKRFYRELGTRDPPNLPQWASHLPLGTLCSAHFQPDLQIIHKREPEYQLENIKIDQIFAPVKLNDGSISEAPRRVSVEGGPGSGRTTLCLRFLYQWATRNEGPALAFIVPLHELRGTPLLNYLTRELFLRNGYVTQTIQQLWRTLHLLEDNVLFILDGYDECTRGRASLKDALDLLEGRLFPDARVLVTCSVNDIPTIPLVQRRLHLSGLEWTHVERLCVAYFIHNNMAEKACEFLEMLNIQPLSVRQLGQHPFGWIMLCVLYQDYGNLPAEMSALVQAAVKCIVKRSLEPPVPSNEEIPSHCRKRLEDFGKLALAALRERRCCYNETELRTHGGGLEITRLGFLNKGIIFGQRRKSDFYTPIHLAIAEFLAAYYLTSVAQYANILRRELEGLPPGIISHLAGLLGHKTHLVLNQLCPLEAPPRAMFSLLKVAGASDGNVTALCRLVGAEPGFGPAPNERPSAPLVHTSPLELEGWARILESSACSLEAVEVVFQVERGSNPRYLNEFFEALTNNESVKLVRITSLLGQEFPTDEVLRLAEHVRSVLGKNKLHEFELVITCLEESAHDRLECVVDALCRGINQASSYLSRIVLDMNLSCDQVSRVCKSLRYCHQIQALHLPHLGCGCEGLTSVAYLLKERPLIALNLAGSWGTKNDDPSSSGISMGSGSGSRSSDCASSTLGSLPTNNQCYSSLPRSALTTYDSSNLPATLPRLPLELDLGVGISCTNGNGTLPSSNNDRDRDSSNGSKRNSDSVLCHRLPSLHPLPTCDAVSHQGTGFHEIFNAIREVNCKLHSLNVSKCLLSSLDAICLGETIRRARNLDAVRAAGATRPRDVMPLVLALAEAPCLQLLDIASPRLALDDHTCRLLCHALARNSTLRLLSLEGWTFKIEEWETLSMFSNLLRCTSVRELNLCNARLHLAVHEGPLSYLGRRDDVGAELLKVADPPVCSNVVFLRLAGFQVTVNDRLALRGPLLLPFLAGFTGLSDLDLSLDKSTIGDSNSSLLFIEDRIFVQFFNCLALHFHTLQSLRINFWRVNLDDSTRSLRQMGKQLRNCTGLSFFQIAGLVIIDNTKKISMEHSFVQAILTNLQSLKWLCLDGIDITENQAASIGKCLRESFTGINLEITAKDMHVKAVKALVTSIEDGGKAEVLYTGGATCRLKIVKLLKNTKNTTNRKK